MEAIAPQTPQYNIPLHHSDLGFSAEENWVYLANGIDSRPIDWHPSPRLFSAPWGMPLGSQWLDNSGDSRIVAKA